MLGALNAVSEGMGINRAAEQFEVPKTTLKDRVSGKIKHGSKPGRTPYLSNDEEKELVSYLNTCSKIGYPKTRDNVVRSQDSRKKERWHCWKILMGRGGGFERWPELALRKGGALAQPRARAANADIFARYFSLLEETLQFPKSYL